MNNWKAVYVAILVVLVLALPLTSLAKRAAPLEVPTVTYKGVTYQVEHWGSANGTGQNGGYVEARDAGTNQKVWGLVVYTIEYRPELERDIQDVFITSLRVHEQRGVLLVENERDEAYEVDLVSLKVTKVM
ncbi:hypothetical protein P9J64_12720 [Deltaproteobacteria bacterium IMCC39524]|nr:hypothetical protein [Deltaproteobacteria bacterium IMCC39524]